MQQDPSVRNLRIVGLSFIPVVLGGTIAIVALRSGWDERADALATVGLAVTIALSLLGLVVALRWRTSTTERTVSAARLTTSYFITLALAETPLLAGFVFALVARDALPFWIGAGSFVVSLIVILTALGLVELEGDGSPTRLIR
jgi:F0F1-type ATP synthase membrane subunit c/vacuolar-type H+-ATPase subunit K